MTFYVFIFADYNLIVSTGSQGDGLLQSTENFDLSNPESECTQWGNYPYEVQYAIGILKATNEWLKSL